MHCTTCREELIEGDRRCPACQTRVRPSILRRVIPVAVVIGLLFALNRGLHRIDALAKERGAWELEKDALPGKPKLHRTATVSSVAKAPGPAAATTTVVSVPPKPLVPISAEASSVADSATNGCGQQTIYDAAQVLDSDPNTAWRAVGNGKNVKLTLVLGEAHHLTEVGLIPGYDKTDQCTGIDRFVQMRRIQKVRWNFDDGTSVEQTFADERAAQLIPVDAVTTKIVIEILATTAARELDYTAISDVRITGN